VGEHVDVDHAGHDQVVVSRQADGRALVDDLHAPHGVGAVADDVAEAPDLVHLDGVDRLEHRLERLDVPVHVRDDGHLHRRTIRLPLVSLAAVQLCA